MTNASDDPFLSDLIDEFGLEGLARWWLLLETIAKSMDESRRCSVTLPWTKWQKILHGKRKKLETFLLYCENNSKLFLVHSGNKLEIGCRNLLKLRDNYSKNLQAKKIEEEVDNSPYKGAPERDAESPPAQTEPPAEPTSPPPHDDGSSGIPPPRRPGGFDQSGLEMQIGAWQPGDMEVHALKRSGVDVTIEAEDVAAFSAHYAGRWMPMNEIHKRFVSWMIRKKQYAAERGGNRGSRHERHETRAAAFARAVGDPWND